jgi:hypothetical protein
MPASNPRLQRTPPASPPSPLSRKPLGRVSVLLLFALVGIACSPEPDWTGISVNATEAWADATVTIDGQKAGTLEYLMLHNTAAEKALEKKGNSPILHSVALNIPFDPKRARPGVHRIRIEKPGQPPVDGQFTWPDPRGSRVQFLSIVGQSLMNDPSPDASDGHR